MTDATPPPLLLNAFRSARSVAVLTGAGVSAASGLPTFRDAMTGVWERYRPEDLATPEAFQRDPRLVWEWYEWRRGLLRRAMPNPAHIALAKMQRLIPHFTLITQNVDGLHQRAGSTGVLELHGSLTRTTCSRDGVIVEQWNGTEDVPPRCPRCDAPLRPGVVWFGESLPAGALQEAAEAAADCDVFLSVGTSGQVEPAASLLGLSARHGAVTAVFNLQPGQQADFTILGPADQTLRALVKAAWPDDDSAL